MEVYVSLDVSSYQTLYTSPLTSFLIPPKPFRTWIDDLRVLGRIHRPGGELFRGCTRVRVRYRGILCTGEPVNDEYNCSAIWWWTYQSWKDDAARCVMIVHFARYAVMVHLPDVQWWCTRQMYNDGALVRCAMMVHLPNLQWWRNDDALARCAMCNDNALN